MAGEALEIPQTHRLHEQLQVVEQGGATGKPTFQLDAHHAAKTAGEGAEGIVARMVGKPRVDHLLHRRMGGQEVGHLLGVVQVGIHAQGQGLDPALQQVGLLRAYGGADVLEGHGTDRLHQCVRARHHPGDDVAVTAQVFGAAVHDDVDAKLERAQQIGGEEGVVTHSNGAHLAGRFHHHPRIHHLEGGVGQGFEQYHLGGGADVGQQILIALVGGDLDAGAAEGLLEKRIGAAVERADIGHFIAAVGQGIHDGAHRRHAARHHQRLVSAFQRRQLLLQLGGGGVAKAAVDEAGGLTCEALLARLGVEVAEGAALVERGGEGAGLGIDPLAAVHAHGLEFHCIAPSLPGCGPTACVV